MTHPLNPPPSQSTISTSSLNLPSQRPCQSIFSIQAARQLGTAMWVIDVLALRVGGEKGEDEADTVGCCSLRREHLTFNADAETYEIELEFLGKDSMQYKQNINFGQYGEVGKLVYRCLKTFCAGKKADEDVFETLDPTLLNKHLTSLMKGLTAKVFRTFNASITLEKGINNSEHVCSLCSTCAL